MDITQTPDRDLADALFYIDVRRAEHSEIDCDGGGEYRCERCEADYVEAREIRAELARREANGVEVVDPDAPTLEERLGPYGIEWELEQRDRQERIW